MSVPFLTKKDVVAETLRNDILSGLRPPGSAIQQDEVAQRLNVSATPIREAFRMLEAEGLLESRPHHGVVVARHEFSDIEAIYEMRALIEPRALRHAGEIGEALIGELREQNRRSEQLLRLGEVQAFRKAGLDFHRVLARASRSRVYSEFALALLGRAMLVVPLDEERMAALQEQHTAIAETVASKRLVQAASLLQRHLDDSVRQIRRARLRVVREAQANSEDGPRILKLDPR